MGGLVARLTYTRIWSLIDKRDPPDAEHRDVPLAKLLLALALQGAVFRTAAGAADHLARRAFMRVTGRWPGEERPEA